MPFVYRTRCYRSLTFLGILSTSTAGEDDQSFVCVVFRFFELRGVVSVSTAFVATVPTARKDRVALD